MGVGGVLISCIAVFSKPFTLAVGVGGGGGELLEACSGGWRGFSGVVGGLLAACSWVFGEGW